MAAAVRRPVTVHSLSAMRGTPLRSSPAVLAVGLLLVLGVSGCGDPGGTPGPAGTANPGPGETPSPVTEDCVNYDAQRLQKNYAAGVHAIWADGLELIRVYGGPGDDVGNRALAAAQHWSTICYIGRGNSFNNPDFVFEYWRDPSPLFGTPWPPAGGGYGHMVLYDFTVLRVEEMLPGGWRVIADSKDLQHFATEEDANRGLAVFALWDEFGMIDSYTPAPMVGPAHITYNLYERGGRPRPS
jgi:hypothetical protein